MQISFQRQPLAGWPLALAVLAIASVIWFLLSANSDPHVSGTVGLAVDAPCQNEADVLRAADRSRNGISISCNLDTMASSRAAR